MRSREISVSIIIQNMAQLKALFKESWENITGNCDTLLYLGGNEQSTHEYISKMLGKATIDTRTHGLTKGRNGSSSTNYQNTGRELLTIDEVRQMDNENALLFIRGERPVMDKKYDLLKHPNIKQTQDGGNAPYQHGQAAVSYALDDIPYSIEDPDEIEIIKF
jgi:type IV secretion system protein VirD4